MPRLDPRVRTQRLARFLLWMGLALFVLGTAITAWGSTSGWYSYSAVGAVEIGDWQTAGVIVRMVGLGMIVVGCVCKAVSSRGSEAEERGNRRERKES